MFAESLDGKHNPEDHDLIQATTHGGWAVQSIELPRELVDQRSDNESLIRFRDTPSCLDSVSSLILYLSFQLRRAIVPIL